MPPTGKSLAELSHHKISNSVTEESDHGNKPHLLSVPGQNVKSKTGKFDYFTEYIICSV